MKIRHILADIIGVISLVVILFGSLWALPIISVAIGL